MTQLAKKFDDIAFIGVSSEPKSVAAPFVHQQGAQMDYRVASDVGNSANQALMQKFGARGIPTAFVIDREGKVAWHGHPADQGFESALERVRNQKVAKKNELSEAELKALPVKQLKEILAAHRISIS